MADDVGVARHRAAAEPAEHDAACDDWGKEHAESPERTYPPSLPGGVPHEDAKRRKGRGGRAEGAEFIGRYLVSRTASNWGGSMAGTDDFLKSLRFRVVMISADTRRADCSRTASS